MKKPVRKTKPVQQTRWEIFLPARLGPNRIVKKIIGGITYTRKERRPELPFNQNTRMNWRVKAKIAADWRSFTALTARSQSVPTLKKVKISAIFHRKVIGRADWDGDVTRLKHLIDGLVDAGIAPDDRRAFMTYGSIDEQKMDERGIGVTLILEDMSDGTGNVCTSTKGKRTQR